MKKTLKTIIALFMVLSLTVGCTMREHIKMVIDEDGTTSMNLIVAMDNEMIDGMLSMQNMNGDSDPTAAEKKTYTDEERWAYIEIDSDDSAFGSLDDSYKKEAPAFKRKLITIWRQFLGTFTFIRIFPLDSLRFLGYFFVVGFSRTRKTTKL